MHPNLGELYTMLPRISLELKRPQVPSYRKPKLKRMASDMSVCIAAIHNDGGIVCVSDKMLSAGDITFEPRGTTKKMFALAPAVIALNAGHVAIQAEIMQMMQTVFNKTKETEPDKKYTVSGLVDTYMDCYNEAKRRRINDSIFAPWNLTIDSFQKQQKDFSDVFVRDLMDSVSRFEMPDTETIIAGIDNSTGILGPHIYCVKRGSTESMNCCDSIGFSTIGIGARHVEAQFMESQFTRHFSMPKTMLLAYMAKRRAEVAPNVGKQTDMWLIGPTLAVNANLGQVLENYEHFAYIYKTFRYSEKGAEDIAYVEIQKYLKDKLPCTESPFDMNPPVADY